MALAVLIGSLASFALGRMRLGAGSAMSTAALLIYMVPAYFLIIPFYLLMHAYGLMDSLWAVIAADVTSGQVYVRIYLSLMVPALAAVGTYALLTTDRPLLCRPTLHSGGADAGRRERLTVSTEGDVQRVRTLVAPSGKPRTRGTGFPRYLC